MSNSRNISQKQLNFLYVMIHILTWTMIIMLPYVLFDRSDFTVTLKHFLFIGKGIVLFYLNYFILLPKLLLNKRIGLYLISVLFIVSLNSVINYLYPPKPIMDKRMGRELHFEERQKRDELFPLTGKSFRDGKPPHSKLRVISQLTLSLLIIGIGTSFKLAEVFFKNQKISEQIQREHLNTELIFLKAQINPHFLFNSLNSIYSLAHKKSDLAPESIIRLSKIMRYVIDDSKSEKVLVSREVEHLTDYIELQKLRLTDKTKVSFKQSIENTSLHIEPMLLVPFIENAFKHGIDSINDSLIDIDISLKKRKLKFTCTNTIARNKTETKEANSGIGFQNVKRRLQLLYPGKHKLEVMDGNKIFSVNLTIRLRN